MEDFETGPTTRYSFGRKAELRCGATIAAAGGHKVLVVSGVHSAARSGLLERVRDALTRAHLAYISLTGITPNPTLARVYEGVEIGRSQRVDWILAVGGAGVIDTAKAIAVGIPHPGDVGAFYRGEATPRQALPIGVILTCPGAGAESSPAGIMLTESDGPRRPRTLRSRLIQPAVAWLNPELTTTLPPEQTAYGIAEIVARILSGYLTDRCEVTIEDRVGEGLLAGVIDNACRVFDNGDDYAARANLMWAAALAGDYGRRNATTLDGAPFKLAQPLAALYDLPLGAALAVVIPAWLDFVCRHDVMRLAQLACRACGCVLDFAEPLRTAAAGVAAVRDLWSHLRLPQSFAELGAAEADIPQMLNLLGVDDRSLTVGHFVTLYRTECERIYRQAAGVADDEPSARA